MIIIVTISGNYCEDYMRCRQGATVPGRWYSQKMALVTFLMRKWKHEIENNNTF